MSEVKAEMAGVVERVLVGSGAKVSKDQELVVIESMKMLVKIFSPSDGEVVEVKVGPGDFVQEGDTLLVLE
ncbi:MAG: biotin/lipoyl-binding protein [Actinobacteria bacterium]|nr:biotin/lipoyl-binding protein [Actinomycetota bacterium]